MAQIDILTQQVAALTQAVQQIYDNARKTNEFPLQSPLVDTSLIRVEESGVSKYVTASQLVNEATKNLNNELLYFAGATVVGNTVTALAGSVWTINGLTYTNASDVVFTVPYCTTSGDFRMDLFVGDNTNNVTQIIGDEDDFIIKPITPTDKVVVFSIQVTDSTIFLIDANGFMSVSYNISVAGTQTFTIPSGAVCQSVHINEGFIPKKDVISDGWVNNWELIGDNVTIKKTTSAGQRVHITFKL